MANCTLLAGILVLVVGLTGCGSQGPKPVPVKGKVVFERGGDVQALSDRGALLEFQAVDQPEVRAFGEILADGSFTLSAVHDGAPRGPGALAGTYRGRLNMDQEVRHLVSPQFLDFAKSGITITVPDQADVVIKIHK